MPNTTYKDIRDTLNQLYLDNDRPIFLNFLKGNLYRRTFPDNTLTTH